MFLSIYPRNVLEFWDKLLVLISIIIYEIGEFEIKETLPLLGAPLGAQRLLPAMQQSYNVGQRKFL